MLIHNVVMVLLLAGNDGSQTLGIIPYKDYDSCYKSLEWAIDPSRYVHVDRVCMSGKAFDNVVVLNHKIFVKKPTNNGQKD